jgi:proline iminopeptidase
MAGRRTSSWCSLALFMLTTACGGASIATEDGSPALPPPREPDPTPTTPAPAPPSSPAPPASSPQRTDLFFKTFGDPKNRAVVFLHGGPGASSFAFEESAAPDIAARGWFVVSYDQRGSGRSPAGAAKDYSYDGAARDLRTLLLTLDLKSPILIGHSFGGSIALNFIDREPGVARGAILLGSPINFPETYFTIIEHATVVYRKWWTPLGDADKAREMETLRQKMFPNGLKPPFTYSNEDIGAVAQAMVSAALVYPSVPSLDAIAILAKLGIDPNRELVSSVHYQVGNGFHDNDRVGYADFTPLVQKYKEIVFAVYGAEDGIFDDHQLGTIRTTLPSGHFVLLESSSHFPFVDQREKTVEAIATHLAAMK